ncbi:MAG: sigma-70 family RNA polymerase sigma factor [Methylocystis sp.]|nr:sigma-70 family RNA polymerase sigma factor [Methylocystis sp.]
MVESTEGEYPDDDAPPAPPKAGRAEGARDGLIRPLAKGSRRPDVEAELVSWLAVEGAQQRLALRQVIEGGRAASAEALIHLCRRAHEAGDRQTLNLAFEALGKRATPLLLSQAWGLSTDERREQVQDILLETFEAIRKDKADFAESNFAAFAKRKAISLYRSRRARFEGANKRIEPTEEVDPLDNVPARIPSAEVRALLAISLDKLSPKHRAIFIQYHQFEMTQEEIAAHHRVTVRTVYSWLKAAEAAVGLSGDENDR